MIVRIDPDDLDSGALLELDALLRPDGHLRPVPSSRLLGFSPETLLVYGHFHQIYQYPTTELIEFIGNEIVGTALEICSGVNELGRMLGIRRTDSGLQSAEHAPPRMHEIMAISGFKLKPFPQGVERIDANTVVLRDRPQTVVGSWVMERGHQPGQSVDGVDEQQILRITPRYISIGNIGTHGKKQILGKPNREISEPWLVSRSKRPELNRLWVWGC